MELDEDILTRKIANLLRRAERDDGPEARTAGRLAERLMDKHNLQVVLDPAESPGYEVFRWRVVAADRSWVTALSGALAPEHACNAYFHPTPEGFGFLVITGHTDNVEAFKAGFDRYLKQIRTLAGRRDSPSFRLGAATAVYDMFHDQRERDRETRKAREPVEPTTALVRTRRHVHMPPPPPPGNARPRPAEGGVDMPLPPEASSPYMEHEQAEAAWVEPPINGALYRIGYSIMRKALGFTSSLVEFFRGRRRA